MESLALVPTLREVISRPFSVRGLVASVVCALPMLLDLSELDLHVPALFLSGTALAFVYQLVVRHGGRGEDGFPLPRVRSRMDRAVLGRALFGGVCLLFLALLPTFVWRSIAGADAVFGELELFGSFLLTSLFLPAAIVAVAVEGSAAAAFWPFGWARIARGSGLEYVKLVLGYSLAMIVVAFAQLTVEAVAPWSGLLSFTITAVANLVWLAQAAWMGTFVRRYVEDVPVMSARKPILASS